MRGKKKKSKGRGDGREEKELKRRKGSERKCKKM